MKLKDQILGKVSALGDGVVFGYSDLDLSADKQSAGVKTLSRLVADNQLRKVGKGKFYKPALSRLGEMPLMIEQLTKDLLFKDGLRIGYITGIPAFAQLGLTTQISTKILIGSPKYRRPLKRAGYDISCTNQSNEITDESIPLLRILDAIKFIKSIPASSPDEAMKVLISLIKSKTSTDICNLIKYSETYAPYVRAILGAILDEVGITDNEIQASLNPFTKYEIGLSDSVLPTKSKWNIA